MPHEVAGFTFFCFKHEPDVWALHSRISTDFHFCIIKGVETFLICLRKMVCGLDWQFPTEPHSCYGLFLLGSKVKIGLRIQAKEDLLADSVLVEFIGFTAVKVNSSKTKFQFKQFHTHQTVSVNKH